MDKSKDIEVKNVMTGIVCQEMDVQIVKLSGHGDVQVVLHNVTKSSSVETQGLKLEKNAMMEKERTEMDVTDTV